MIARVWAPKAESVACVVNGEPQPMTGDDDGWFTGPDLPPGDDYAFSLDGGTPLPDPRSAWQPHGVHGPSRAFDPAAHTWMDADWSGMDARGVVTYEVHVGTFTPGGTLDSAIAALPRLAQAGIQMVELMPLSAFPGERGWGYDGVAPFSVHDAYGGPTALQRFVDAAHGLGLGVTLDIVYNHLGPDGNYLFQFGPYFTDKHETPWGWAVNLDQEGSTEVRRYIIDNARRWFTDFHVDALRLDAVHALEDDSEVHVLAELSDAVGALAEELGRPLSLVAESDLNDPAMVTPTSVGGLGMTAQWDDDFHHALHAYLTGERHGYYVDFGSVEVLDHVLRRVFWHDGTFSTFRGRTWGAQVPDAVDRHRFVVCASNHDQIGNRAIGDRPSATLAPGAQAASLAVVLLSPFTPMLFMGEEYGERAPFQFFTDHDEPLGSAVTEGRTAEFSEHGWEDLYGGEITVPDPQDPATFEASRIHPDDLDDVQVALRRWFDSVMDARSDLTDAAWNAAPPSAAEIAPRQLMVTGPVAVYANLSDAPMPVPGAQVRAVFGTLDASSYGHVLAPGSVAIA